MVGALNTPDSPPVGKLELEPPPHHSGSRPPPDFAAGAALLIFTLVVGVPLLSAQSIELAAGAAGAAGATGTAGAEGLIADMTAVLPETTDIAGASLASPPVGALTFNQPLHSGQRL